MNDRGEDTFVVDCGLLLGGLLYCVLYMLFN